MDLSLEENLKVIHERGLDKCIRVLALTGRVLFKNDEVADLYAALSTTQKSKRNFNPGQLKLIDARTPLEKLDISNLHDFIKGFGKIEGSILYNRVKDLKDYRNKFYHKETPSSSMDKATLKVKLNELERICKEIINELKSHCDPALIILLANYIAYIEEDFLDLDKTVENSLLGKIHNLAKGIADIKEASSNMKKMSEDNIVQQADINNAVFNMKKLLEDAAVREKDMKVTTSHLKKATTNITELHEKMDAHYEKCDAVLNLKLSEQQKPKPKESAQELKSEPSRSQLQQEQSTVDLLYNQPGASPSIALPTKEHHVVSSASNGSSASLKERALNEFSYRIRDQGNIELRKMDMKQDHKDKIQMLQKLSLGTPPNTDMPTKVILLVGATGSGKTTLINRMVNYIFNVDFDDSFRFILIEDEHSPKRKKSDSQTDYITAYFLNHMEGMPFSYNYVLIDTPGYGDTRGIEKDKELMEQLELFFKKSYGIDSVDTFGFVSPSSECRLTTTQQYIFNGLSLMFGKDIKENIFVMATSADSRDPPVLTALEDAEIEYATYFKFNNSFIHQKNKKVKRKRVEDESDKMAEKLEWNMGHKSLESLFNKLGETPSVKLTLTQQVLNERCRLQNYVNKLHKDISSGLSKLSILKQEQNNLNQQSTECNEYERTKVEGESIQSYIDRLSTNIVKLISKAHTHVEHLNKIALKPNSLSIKEYVTFIIDSHKQLVEPISQWHLENLEEIKSQENLHQELILMPSLSSVDDLLLYFRDQFNETSTTTEDA